MLETLQTLEALEALEVLEALEALQKEPNKESISLSKSRGVGNGSMLMLMLMLRHMDTDEWDRAGGCDDLITPAPAQIRRIPSTNGNFFLILRQLQLQTWKVDMRWTARVRVPVPVPVN